MSLPDDGSHYWRLGLDELPADLSIERTLGSGSMETVKSNPSSTDEAAGLPQFEQLELVPMGVIGEGGMGRILLARQQSLGREVAVKVLKNSGAASAAAAALVDEARTTGELEHPGVVPVYALTRDATGSPALVMKRVDGVNWHALVRDARHPAWEAIARGRDALERNLDVLIRVCHAVAFAHRRGILHRDLKPANVLVGELGEVYVADWGVAIRKAELASAPSRLVGTPAYLAPEMTTGDASQMDERTDVYLLGATLCEVLTGAPPHTGATVREALERARVAALPMFPVSVPTELAQICRRALAPLREDRFQTVVALRDELQQFLEHRGASRLTDAAASRLRALETMQPADATLSPRRWYGLVSECRFGFAAALEANPNDAHAASGLEQCLRVAAQTELARGLAASARAFVSEMKAPPLALEQALHAREIADAERVDGEARLKQFEHERDPKIAARQRTLTIVAISATIVVLTLLVWLDNQVFDRVLGRWGRLAPNVVVLAVLGACMALWWKALMSTRINRQLMGILVLAGVAIQINRVATVLMGIEVGQGMVLDGLILAAIIASCGVVLHWAFFGPVLVLVIGSALGLAYPANAIGTFSASSVLAFLLALGLYRVRKKSA